MVPEYVRWIIVRVVTSPMWGALIMHTWELSFRPRLIRAGDINASADKLIATHGSEVEDIASIEADRAWRRSETFQLAKWHRIQRELRRRFGAGKSGGPGDDAAQ